MKLSILLDNVSANGDGAVINPQNSNRLEYGTVQVALGGGSATIKIQGRLSANMPWLDIYSFTANDSARITLFPHMRASVANYVSGVIRAELAE